MQKSGYCLICFGPIYGKNSLNFFLSKPQIICMSCKSKFETIKKEEIINGVNVLFLYNYNGFARELIYKYKGCYDIELNKVFLNDFVNYIKLKYRGHTIIFPPSNAKDDYLRGFNHIEQIVKNLKMPYEILFYKSEEYKQSSVPFNKRKEIAKIIKVKNKIVPTKKYLIIDDIYTSGSTLKSIINILLKYKVDKDNIKGLIIFKVRNCRTL